MGGSLWSRPFGGEGLSLGWCRAEEGSGAAAGSQPSVSEWHPVQCESQSCKYARHMQVTCRSHADHMQGTCKAHVGHMQVPCRSHAGHMYALKYIQYMAIVTCSNEALKCRTLGVCYATNFAG